ncbi:MAG: DUF5309 domain-containing protein [Pseudomonadota bacterium]
MTAPTNTYLTTAAIGNREDLTDIIDRISPTDTPFYSMCAKGKATATLHEFQTQELAAAANNEQVEGDDAVAVAATPSVRLTNRTQISSKTVSVSGSQEAVDSAGRKSEMDYQLALKSAELKNDIEVGLTQNAVSATAPRRSRGLIGWVVDNVDAATAGTAYVAASYTANTAQTDGTQIAFTEARVKNVAQKIYTAGGNPNIIMMGPIAKQTFSTFTGNSTRTNDADDKKLVASIDVYVSDFGVLKAVVNRRQRARDVFVLQSDKWKLAWLRPIFRKELAVTGDAERVQLIGEYSLEAVNPKANGAVYDNL